MGPVDFSPRWAMQPCRNKTKSNPVSELNMIRVFNALVSREIWTVWLHLDKVIQISTQQFSVYLLDDLRNYKINQLLDSIGFFQGTQRRNTEHVLLPAKMHVKLDSTQSRWWSLIALWNSKRRQLGQSTAKLFLGSCTTDVQRVFKLNYRTRSL